jgi:hypothetical protein
LSKSKRNEKPKRLSRPPCPKCSVTMNRFQEGRKDTWMCANPKCPQFDRHLSTMCPACKTTRVHRPSGLFVCLNPECPTYEGDIISNEQADGLAKDMHAKAQTLEAAANRAKKGQGTKTAAKRRREARAKEKSQDQKQAELGLHSTFEEVEEAFREDEDEAIDEAVGAELETAAAGKYKVKVTGLGKALRKTAGKPQHPSQTYISLPDVSREIVSTDYEIYKHVATQLIFRRKVPDVDQPDPLTDQGVAEGKELSDEQKVAFIAKKLKGSKWNARAAESAAQEILKVITEKVKVDGIETDEETINHVVWQAGFFAIKKKEDTWQGEKGKKTKLQKKFAIKGTGTGDNYAKEQHEAARGELRVFTQDGMKKLKGELVEGKQFEGAYVALYRKILIEVNPDDDEDPARSAPVEEWLRSALPDIKVNA